MWLLTNFGFFSVVQKPGDAEKQSLTVRARVKADLESLRQKYIPNMGPIQANSGSDYKYRASISRSDFAIAALKIALDIDYSNFKDSVAANQGKARAGVYHEVWHQLLKLQEKNATTELAPVPKKVEKPESSLPMSYGGVVIDMDGQVLLRKPRGEFDGYVWTFPKGRGQPDETPVEAAMREVSEETGCLVEPLIPIEGTFRGGTTQNQYFLMGVKMSTEDFSDEETESVIWVPFEEAEKFISQTRNAIGRARDLAVLDAARKAHDIFSAGSGRPMLKVRKLAERASWQTQPMPERKVTLAFHRAFDDVEMEQIRLGIVPEEMEEKWFIYFEGDRLYFHRSWTGFCIYIVEFSIDRKRITAVRVEVNRDPSQYTESNDAYDLRMLNYLIDVLLLERRAEWPDPGNLSPEQAAVQQWSHVGKSGL